MDQTSFLDVCNKAIAVHLVPVVFLFFFLVGGGGGGAGGRGGG